MLGEKVASAEFAPFAIALAGFVVRTDVVRTLGNPNTIGLPQCECIDRSSRPMSARTAMTVAHSHWFAGRGKLDRAAETAALIGCVAHVRPNRLRGLRAAAKFRIIQVLSVNANRRIS